MCNVSTSHSSFLLCSPSVVAPITHRLEEHRQLFSPYRSVNRARGGNTSNVGSRRSRRPRSASGHIATHTHTFVCLENKDASTCPSSTEKQELFCGGLGERKIQSDDASEVHKKLIETYPKLVESGGYELLQTCGTSKYLISIPQPHEGYSALYSKSIGSSAKVNVRPIQHSLKVNTAEDAPSTQVCFWCLLGYIVPFFIFIFKAPSYV